MPAPVMTIADWEAQRQEKLSALAAWCGPIPAHGPLDIAEESRTEFRTHTEIKINYDDETGARIPAYLLVPRSSATKRFAAIVAAHQCAWACDLGKEQVVGKSVDWQDQAYGLELVRRGFIVIAPDANKVGERFDPALRQRWQTAHVWSSQHACCTAPGGSWHSGNRWKRVYDVMRAVDVLCAHPQVDPSRIGMIGHSLGADTTLWAMPFDPRISAAAISCGGLMSFEQRGEFLMGLPFAGVLKLLAPRAFSEAVGFEDVTDHCAEV